MQLESKRQIVPPAIRKLVNRLLGSLNHYQGPYETWEAAGDGCSGYDDAAILARVSKATQRVLQGKADFEQDGRALRGDPGSSHALQGLLLAAARDCGQLRVLDFGGGLGSHFLRWRQWLEALPEVHWCVVEQTHFAREGALLLAGFPAVSFATSIERARGFGPTVVLASSVLQYLSDPMTVLNDLSSLDPRLIVIDRTPFSRDGMARILTQHVPKSLGAASYPLWTLSRAALHDVLGERYRLLAEFPSDDAPIGAGRIRADYTGCIWLRKD